MAARSHYLELDGLRGVAALSVALFHLQAFFGGAGFFGHGYLAVDFFFMLSGFVLAHAYGERLRHRGSLLPYLRDRLIRLHPMLAVGALLGLMLALIEGTHSMAEIVAAALVNAVGLPAIWSATPFWINSPTWSLFFELFANLLFGLTAFLIRPLPLAVATGLFIILMLVLDHRHGLFAFGWMRWDLAPGIVRVCASFTTGIVLLRVHSRGFLANGGKRWWVAPALVISFVLCPTFSRQSVIYDPLIVFGLYPLLILAAAGSKEIIPRIATLSGALSYPFYVVHVPLLGLLQNIAELFGRTPGKTLVIVNLLSTIAISWLLLRYYDQPLRDYLRRRFGSRAHRSTVMTSVPTHN